MSHCEHDSAVVENSRLTLRLAKVQVLDFISLDAKTRLPIIKIHDDNLQTLIKMDHIGSVIVCAEHPDADVFGAGHFLVLPWPRQKGFMSSL